MRGQQTMMKRTLLLVGMMAATLVTASGMALAVSKVCPPGTTQANPCAGTKGIDNLVGTAGPDYITGLGGNDKISAGGDDDTTDGGAGNDTYSYKGGWGTDTLIDSGGTDALNFSAVEGAYGVEVRFVPEFSSSANYARDTNSGARVNPSSGTVVEKVTGSSKYDSIITGAGPNTLQPGPETGGAGLEDRGGQTNSSGVSIPVSNDTYSGFASSGYGLVYIEDFGGTADKLVFPFASTDAYFEAVNDDGIGGLDNLLIMTSSTDSVYIYGQLEPWYGVKGHIEQIQFTDETITIGSENAQQAQALNAEAQVEKLNGASKLDEAEKQKREEAAKKAIEEAKQKKEKAQDLEEKLSASGKENKR